MKKLFVIGLASTLALLVGYVAFMSYSRSKEAGLMRMSRQFVAHGQFNEARLSLSEVLRLDKRNVEATRLMADMVAGDPRGNELQWRQRVVDLDPNSTEDRVALAMVALGVRNLSIATNALNQIPASGQNTAQYQNAIGVLDIALHEPLAAEAAFSAATRLDPASEAPRMNLAVIRLHSTNQVSVAEAVQQLNAFAVGTNASYRCRAMRELIADDFVHSKMRSALALSRKLLAEPDSSFSDRILQLDLLQRASDPGLSPALVSAEAAAGKNVELINPLAQWEIGHLPADRSLDWLTRLPRSLQTNQPVAMLSAECRMALHDWSGLQQSLQAQNWQIVDFMRHALLAKAFYGEQLTDSMNDEWAKAVQGAGVGLRNLTVLLQLTMEWKWTAEQTDLLSSILKHHPEAKWAVPLMMKNLEAGGRTRELMNLFEQQVEQDPNDLQAKNNLAMTALLLNETELKPFDLSSQVYGMEPTNISYASTYAFSLYEQNRPADALKVFAPFDVKSLSDTGVAGYYGLVLRANGHEKMAREYLARAATNPNLLPEERKLFGLTP